MGLLYGHHVSYAQGGLVVVAKKFWAFTKNYPSKFSLMAPIWTAIGLADYRVSVLYEKIREFSLVKCCLFIKFA